MGLGEVQGNQAPETLWTALQSHAAATPDKIAFRVVDTHQRERETITYASLLAKANRRAAWLSERGYGGRTVASFLPTGVDFIVDFFAVLRGGGSLVPLNSRLSVGQLDALKLTLLDAGAPLVVADGLTADRLRSALGGESSIAVTTPSETGGADASAALGEPLAHPSTIAVIQYTSGSTSEPKGVCISHANFLANAHLLTRTFRASSADSSVSWLPLFHDMGLMTGLVWPVVAGASAVLMKAASFAVSPVSWLQALSDHRAAISAAPNFAFQHCVDRVKPEETATLDLSSWRVAICGAEPVNPVTLERFVERFEPCGFDARCFYPSYGLAEATLFVTGGRATGRPRLLAVDARTLEQEAKASPRRPGAPWRSLVACGEPASNLDVRIVDPQSGLPLPERAVGEIWVSGPSVSAGYKGRADINSKAFRRIAIKTEEHKSYLCTGDLGFFDQGELFIVGRLKDQINVRGAKHAPQDLEFSCLQAHAGLAGCRGAAFAVESDQDLDLVILHEMQPGAVDQAPQIIEAVRVAIAQAHGLILNTVVLLPPRTLPTTSSGKIRRAAARSAWLAGHYQPLASWKTDNTQAMRTP